MPSRQPSSVAVLLAIVAEAQQSLNRRLVELGAQELDRETSRIDDGANDRSLSRDASSLESSLRVCVDACRACGRSLGAAFREAQSVADAASARILYGSIRALEKQLWVLDPCQVY